jgi:hypothetical protein
VDQLGPGAAERQPAPQDDGDPRERDGQVRHLVDDRQGRTDEDRPEQLPARDVWRTSNAWRAAPAAIARTSAVDSA